MSPLLLAALACALVALACAVLLLAHAFRRSVGTGVMVLLIPAYVLVYAFRQFEHPRKGLVVAAFVGASVLGAVLLGIALAQAAPPELAVPPGF